MVLRALFLPNKFVNLRNELIQYFINTSIATTVNVYGLPGVSEAEKPSTSSTVSMAVSERTQVSDYIVYIV